jgi:predicted short-subunit dehydrogenase-like oxidoreductase (DUF2520 family)
LSNLPELDRKTPIAVVAAGRLGSSLAHAALKAGYNVVAISSRRASHRKWLASRLTSPTITENAQIATDLAAAAFITGPDSVINEICDGITWRSDQAVLHCAGVLPLSALTHATEQGAATAGFHPLQTFPSPESSDRLHRVSFAIESQDSELRDWLARLATDLGGSSIEIESGQRASYHASAVMACGLLAGLAGIAAEMWEPLGVDRGDALRRLIPLIRATADALEEHGLPSAITGPFVRGDTATIESHLEATNQLSIEVGRAYAALAQASLHIAKEQGGLSDDAYERIKSLLSLGN